MRDLLASLEIGPRLLDEDTQGIVDEADVNALGSAVFLEENRKDREESLEEAAVQSLLYNQETDTSSTSSITEHRQINVIANDNFARAWRQMGAGEVDTVDAPRGNNRDRPTPFVFRHGRASLDHRVQ